MDPVTDIGPFLPLSAIWAAARRHPAYRRFGLPDHPPDPGSAAWDRLPTLTKTDLRRHGAAGTPSPDGDRLYFTSGTTSDPMMLPLSGGDLDRIGAYCATLTRIQDIAPGARVLVILPMALWAAGPVTVRGHRLAGGHVFPVDLHGGPEDWSRFAHLVRPTVISSTPSVMTDWAPRYTGPPVEVVEVTGEPLRPEHRAVIRAAFGGRVHDAYGLSECVVGAECRIGDGFHVAPEAVIAEVLAAGRDAPAPPGTEGEITLTSLMQTALPILRYRTGDRGRWVPEPCPCGRSTPRLRVLGRMAETWAMPRGITSGPTDVREALAAAGLSGRAVVWRNAKPDGPTLEIEGPDLPPRETVAALLARELPHIGELIAEGEIALLVGSQ
jgi:phenylacetate-CoA ligase